MPLRTCTASTSPSATSSARWSSTSRCSACSAPGSKAATRAIAARGGRLPESGAAAPRPPPADGGVFRYDDVGMEHLAFVVDTREELEDAYTRCLDLGAKIHFPPEEDRDIPGYWEMFVFDPDGMRSDRLLPAERSGRRALRLGRQDSNLGSRDQSPLPYRLATPHRPASLRVRPTPGCVRRAAASAARAAGRPRSGT